MTGGWRRVEQWVGLGVGVRVRVVGWWLGGGGHVELWLGWEMGLEGGWRGVGEGGGSGGVLGGRGLGKKDRCMREIGDGCVVSSGSG